MSDSVTQRPNQGGKSTDVDLLRHVESRIDAQADAQVAAAERIMDSIRALTDKETAWQLAHNREHTMLATALNQAQAVAEEWRKGANEWRETLKDFTATVATQQDITNIEEKLVAMGERSRIELQRAEEVWNIRVKSLEEQVAKAEVGTVKRVARQDAPFDALRWVVAVGSGILGIAALLYALFGK